MNWGMKDRDRGGGTYRGVGTLWWYVGLQIRRVYIHLMAHTVSTIPSKYLSLAQMRIALLVLHLSSVKRAAVNRVSGAAGSKIEQCVPLPSAGKNPFDCLYRFCTTYPRTHASSSSLGVSLEEMLKIE